MISQLVDMCEGEKFKNLVFAWDSGKTWSFRDYMVCGVFLTQVIGFVQGKQFM